MRVEFSCGALCSRAARSFFVVERTNFICSSQRVEFPHHHRFCRKLVGHSYLDRVSSRLWSCSSNSPTLCCRFDCRRFACCRARRFPCLVLARFPARQRALSARSALIPNRVVDLVVCRRVVKHVIPARSPPHQLTPDFNRRSSSFVHPQEIPRIG